MINVSGILALVLTGSTKIPTTGVETAAHSAAIHFVIASRRTRLPHTIMTSFSILHD